MNFGNLKNSFMRTRHTFLAAAFALIFGGCAQVRLCHYEKTMVDIECSCWQLFSWIPIASGDPEAPNEVKCKIFSDSVNLHNNMELLDYAIAKEGATGAKYVVSYYTDEYAFIFLLRRHSLHTSAELIMPGIENLVKDLVIKDSQTCQ